MKEFETIIFAAEGAVATITLNRSDSYNALNETMCFELQDAVAAIAADDGIRAMVLTGSGRAFSSGQDLRGMEEPGEDAAAFVRNVLERRYRPLILAMRRLPKPIIGAVNGVAAGAGMSLALACDLRIAADSASFIQAFSRVGLVPDAGSSFLLTRLVGLPRALEIAWSARRVGADEALALGLVNRVVPVAELQAAALELAQTLARGPALALALTKEEMQRGLEVSLEEALTIETDFQARCVSDADFGEGVAAFLEKREPRFGGRPEPAPATSPAP
jgi:2-(1,2-epoxy-1,2-dihydrophenyl)acetyl-CoA isomerase